jgi:hypothetical protein
VCFSTELAKPFLQIGLLQCSVPSLVQYINYARLAAVLDPYARFVVDCRVSFSRELNMKKIILVGLAIFAVSTSAALAKSHMKKPKAAAAATTTAGPMMMGQPSAADHAQYMKNKHDSGMK